jgi:SAM-dependent methyltransferase
VGLDLLADPKWLQAGLPAYLAGNALALPFADATFDTVIAFETLEHLQQPEVALAEIHRVARKNLILSVPDCETPEELLKGGLTFAHFRDRTHCTFFTEDSLIAVLRNSGFCLESIGRTNACLIDYPVLHSLHVPPRLAYLAARILRRIPFRTQYPMTLLAVADKV